MLLNLRHDHGDRGHGRDRDIHERGHDHDVHARAYDHGCVHVRVCAHAHAHAHVHVHVYDRDRHLHGNARGELYLIKVQHPQDRQW